MALPKRTRVTLKGTDISYDVLPGRVEPVEVFKGGVPISRLAPVDAHLVTITLLTKLREQWRRQAAARSAGAALDRASTAMDGAFEEVDRAMGAADEALSKGIGSKLSKLRRWRFGR